MTRLSPQRNVDSIYISFDIQASMRRRHFYYSSHPERYALIKNAQEIGWYDK